MDGFGRWFVTFGALRVRDMLLTFIVYAKGILIINGAYGLSDADQAKLTQLELTLDLNMAACQLKLQNYLKVIDHCKMARVFLCLFVPSSKALTRACTCVCVCV